MGEFMRLDTDTLSLICPECGGEMEKHWISVIATHDLILTCKKCSYTCKESYVIGFWAGVRAMKKKINEIYRLDSGRRLTE